MTVGVGEADHEPAAGRVQGRKRHVLVGRHPLQIRNAREPEPQRAKAGRAFLGCVQERRGAEAAHEEPSGTGRNFDQTKVREERAHRLEVRRAEPDVGDVFGPYDAHDDLPDMTI